MRFRRTFLISFLILVIIPISWSAWRWGVNGDVVPLDMAPTLAPTAIPVSLVTILPTDTAVSNAPATATTIPTSTAPPTLPPTYTPIPTLKPTSTTVPIGRVCPDSSPLKPYYERYVVSENPWPSPYPTLAEPHFWLAKPLPGGGRFLINQNYPYGYDLNGRLLLHNGVDSAEPLGTPVLAVGDGTIVVAQDDLNEWYGWRCDWYGHLVVLMLDRTFQDKPLFALYGHILNIGVEVGQRVKVGEPLAEVGFGGAAASPHLHFELRLGSNEFETTLNPMLWIDPGQTRGLIVGRLLDPGQRAWQGVGLSLIGKSEDTSSGNTWSYLDDPRHFINPDLGYAENFVFADVKPGEYEVYTIIQGVEYRAPVQVIAGGIIVVEIVTEAYRSPTPEPLVAPTPTPGEVGG